MTNKDGPALAVGKGFYNFRYDRDRFTTGLIRQGHPAADIPFQAAQMTAMYVLHRVRTSHEFGRGMTDEDYQTCRLALQDLLLDIHSMAKPEVTSDSYDIAYSEGEMCLTSIAGSARMKT